MNGQEYCQAVFDELYLPILKERFGDLLDRLSAGVVGRGSEVLGSDDELSRDHGWGASKCHLLLGEADVDRYADDIRQALADVVPEVFHDIPTAKLIPDEMTVSTIDRRYREAFGMAHPPATLAEWATADQNSLCYARRGSVIYDPSGALAERLGEFRLAYYPPDIWKWKVASELWDIWHYGAYNRGRLARRAEGVGLLIGQGYAVQAVMRLLCLFNEQFPVYWKWLRWQFRQLPRWAGDLDPLLEELAAAGDIPQRDKITQKIINEVRRITAEAGLLGDAGWRNFMGSLDIVKTIESPEVRSLIKEHQPTLYVW